MKIPLPHSRAIQKEVVRLHKEAVEAARAGGPQEKVYELHEIIMEWEAVRMYNLYAKDVCKFSKFTEACEGKFPNNLKHYMAFGNCCYSCACFFNYRADSQPIPWPICIN